MSASSVPTGGVGFRSAERGAFASTDQMVWSVLKALGSLKITVVMFFLAIILVLVGTLAQDEQNLTEVKAIYFNSFVATVPLDVFLPITIFPHAEPLSFAFPFPGGATIGLILMINLIAAKLTRFHVSAKGRRLYTGIAISLFGAAVVTAVIISGNATDGLQGKPPIEYETLWILLKAGLCMLTLCSIAAALMMTSLPKLARISLWVIAGLMTGLSTFLLFSDESVRLDDPGLRIVWQLAQSSVAAMLVLAGLWMVFGNRGGNVLIHVGVALMMLGQFIFGDRQVEQRMSIDEGQTTNMVYNQSKLEIALVDETDTEKDTVTVVPERIIRKAASSKQVIESADLPCKLKILKLMPNSEIKPIEPSEKNLATAGIGLRFQALPLRTNGGATSKMDFASAYVEVLEKGSEKSLGVYLLTQHLNDMKQIYIGPPSDQNETVTIDGKPFSFGLRFHREYKPYEITLIDVQRKDYAASHTVRDYSSRIVIRDPAEGTELKGHIWMNNPVRYRSESFYQSEYNASEQNGKLVEKTGLQVVANQGWVIPYVACMLVLFGMTSHFVGVFLRFAGRFDRGAIPTAATLQRETKTKSSKAFWIAASTALGLLLVTAYGAMPPRTRSTEIDWYAIGTTPVMHQGRIKPLDTVARNVLQEIYEPLFGATPQPKDANGIRRSGTAWLLSMMADKDWPAEAKVFRIYAQEPRDYFGLAARKGYLYSYNELTSKADELTQLRKRLQDKRDSREEFTPEEQRLAQIVQKIQLYETIRFSYQLPPMPDDSQIQSEEDRERFIARLTTLMKIEQDLEASNPPAIIPPDAKAEGEDAEKWHAFGPAAFRIYLANKLGIGKGEGNPAVLKFSEVLDALRESDSKKLNSAVTDYREHVQSLSNVEAKLAGVPVESWLNHFSPTNWGVSFYILAMIVALAGTLWNSPAARWTTFSILLVTFLIHTIAIVSRIYVSGRPPVVNLYSSAVFIGWGSVMFAMILELIYPLGVCNLVAAIIGACTLSIARSLDSSDTMHVLEAVLDTQFWLSTHVVTVTLGYGATFLAGIFGIVALSHRMMSRMDRQSVSLDNRIDTNLQNILSRIIYGVLCFAILFSFIGTVLGGLWADDSWGRFWGWDPKENGALMIVLWNALVLHANWDRMIGPRGLAVLAVLGNVVTSWSWFGTNQLGIGLHSYGFTSAVLVTLGIVVVGHVAFVVFSLLMTRPQPKAT